MHDTLLNGYLYLKDEILQQWQRHHAVLTGANLSFLQETDSEQEEQEEGSVTSQEVSYPMGSVISFSGE